MKDDLISRKALKKAIIDNGYSHYFEIFAIIDNAPTVELDEDIIQQFLNKRCMSIVANEYLIALHNKRPQGEWIKIGKYTCECSRCGESVCGNLLNFCPNCGARIIKGGAENER